MGKSSSVTVGYRYFMSILMGIGRGQIDEVVQINVGDVRAWPIPDGDSEATEGLMHVATGPNPAYGVAVYEDGAVEQVPASEINTKSVDAEVQINAGDLFGGDEKEGGVEGTLTLMLGSATQVVPQWIKDLIGGRVPDYRGVTTMFFDGLVTSLNPYPKAWKFRVRRTVSGWDGEVWQPTLATIWMRDNSIKAMNGAHIVYECLTNRDWGRGYPREWISEAHFLQVAQTLYNEGFGICLRWNRQGSIGEFIGQVIDHIGGSMYVDRSTGLIALSLFRGNYDPEELPLYTKGTGLLSVEYGEAITSEDLINEVIVDWKDPVLNTDRQTRAQNLAAIQTLAGKNSTKTPYAGIPEAAAASRVAQRDLKVGASALMRFKVNLDRRARAMVPGQLFRISEPDKDIHNVVVRAGSIRDNGLVDGTISVECVLDVFGLPANSFVSSENVGWAPPSRKPIVPDRRYLREATYADLVGLLSVADMNTVDPNSGAIASLVAKPTTLSLGYAIVSAATGETLEENGSGIFVSCADASSEISTGQTIIPFENASDIGLVEIGMAVQIGDEICRLDDITTTGLSGQITVGRGCVDTIPQGPHPAGTPIYFYTLPGGRDDREYVSGETVDVKVLTKTSTATLSEALAPTDQITIAARHSLPLAPGNFRAGGTVFWDVASLNGSVDFTWAHRNRLTIQDQLVEHGAAGTGAELDTTYNFRVYNSSDALIHETTGITGENFVYQINVTDTLRFELEAERNAKLSWSKYSFSAICTP